jgi:hypothetical protein
MSSRLWIAALLLAAGAVPAAAQRDRNSSSSQLDKPHVVTSDSVERLNPISPLIAQRREIGIPDSLIGKLGAILAQLDAKNARLLRQVDSLAQHPGGPPTISDEARREGATESRRGLVTLDVLIGQISKNNDDAGNDVLKLLSGKPLDRALKVMNDQHNKLNRLLLDSGVGGGRER